MKDIAGKEIKHGDWVFYGVRDSSHVNYRFARVLFTEMHRSDYGAKQERVCVIPILEPTWTHQWELGTKTYLYNAPLIVDTVPEEVLDKLKTHKRYKEWGF